MKYEEFERIYQEYYLKILTFIHKRVPDLYEAEELTGDVFLSFYRNMDSYDEEKGSIATWLYAITANRLKNYYRDKKTHYSLEILKQQTIPREKMPEEIVAKIMREETLRKSLEQLSDREREILLGRFYYWQADEFITGKCKDDTETCSGEVANDYGKTGGIGVQATETLPELTGDNAL